MSQPQIYPVSVTDDYTAIYTSLVVVNGNPAVAFARGW